MRVHHREPDLENHDRGLGWDLPRLLHRRGMLKLVAGAGLSTAGLVSLGACAADSGSSSTAGGPPAPSGGGPTDTSNTAEGEIPEETAGPYPGDGSNGTNVLTQSGIVRSDLTSSFGSSTTRAAGVPLTVLMTIRDFDKGKQALAGAAVYIWHCDQQGRYSLYSSEIANENYLRAVQETDDNGTVRFTSIFPACYDGRWPHIHFEVYPSLAKATSSANKIATSQLALPADACTAVYARSGYEQSKDNLSRVSLATDLVFGDGYDLQVPALGGDATSGYQISLTCAV